MDSNAVWKWKPLKCAQCGRDMKVLMHAKLGVSTPMSSELYRMVQTGEAKGTFSCMECGRCYCYECGDIEKRCVCGKGGWKEGLYMEGKTASWWKRVFCR